MIENMKNNSQKMYQATRIIQQRGPKIPLLVESDHGITTNEEEQVSKITTFFASFFEDKNVKDLLKAEPCKMRQPFTAIEIRKSITSLKNNKSPGIDNLKAEQLKRGPHVLSEKIANILNNSAETGAIPTELIQGILIPLQKPGKKQGPCSNLRPIILLSVLRKILAICLINRIGERIMKHIPPSQAAYQPGRSTTEHVFAYKLLAEKAITSCNYTSNIILMDMSKAFDKVNRKILLEDLKQIVDDDELHLLKLLLDDVELTVRCGSTKGIPFKTNRGVPQGDCLSPIFFILYLAKAQKHTPAVSDHSYAKPRYLETPEPVILKEHDYYVTKQQIYNISKETATIDTEYADDIGKTYYTNLTIRSTKGSN